MVKCATRPLNIITMLSPLHSTNSLCFTCNKLCVIVFLSFVHAVPGKQIDSLHDYRSPKLYFHACIIIKKRENIVLLVLPGHVTVFLHLLTSRPGFSTSYLRFSFISNSIVMVPATLSQSFLYLRFDQA
jgi:hypothetical protein